MKTHQSVALAGLLAVALALSGCATHDQGSRGSSGAEGSTGSGGSSGTGGATGTGGSSSHGAGSATDASGNPTGSSGSSSSSGASGSSGSGTGSGSGSGTGSGTSGMQDDRGNTAAASATPNGTVLAIESLPASGGISQGDSAMGSSGASGATGSSSAGQSYRVTVRMDDGSTQVLTHGSTPDFRSGDRINVTSGAIGR